MKSTTLKCNQTKVMFSEVFVSHSVQRRRSVSRGLPSGGLPPERSACRGLWLQEVCLQRGLATRGSASRKGICPPPIQTAATAVVSTNPTGMHSCFITCCQLRRKLQIYGNRKLAIIPILSNVCVCEKTQLNEVLSRVSFK